MISICAWCGPQGETDQGVSHTICEECLERLYGDPETTPFPELKAELYRRPRAEVIDWRNLGAVLLTWAAIVGIGLASALLLSGCGDQTDHCQLRWLSARTCEGLLAVWSECGTTGLWETGVTPGEVEEIMSACTR